MGWEEHEERRGQEPRRASRRQKMLSEGKLENGESGRETRGGCKGGRGGGVERGDGGEEEDEEGGEGVQEWWKVDQKARLGE